MLETGFKMKFTNDLLKGKLVQRYKRFLADIVLDDGKAITAHCANSGSMLGVKDPGSEVWVSPAQNPSRKLKYTWEMIRVGKSLVGINTNHPNNIVKEAIGNNSITDLLGYASIRREVKYGVNSRIDILLEAPDQPDCYVEVKSVTLKRGKLAEFPDAVTTRGTKHLVELTNQVRAGKRAVMFYLVQREDCRGFTLASDIDTNYAQAFSHALKAGVEVMCYRCKLSLKQIILDAPLSIEY